MVLFLVVKESEVKDPELFKYSINSREIKMTHKLLKSIWNGIDESRQIHIKNYQREFGITEFRGKHLYLVP